MTQSWSENWKLMLETTVLGHLSHRTTDQPWFHYEFTPTDDFAQVSDMFKTELKLLNDDEMEAWTSAYDEIAGLGLRLVSDSSEREVDGETILLHVEGSAAWLRPWV